MRLATRPNRTDLDMLASGQWVRVGKRHYRHASGIEIRYDLKAYLWRGRGGYHDGRAWETLGPARHNVELGGRCIQQPSE